jgi:hypothetical protein
MRKVLVNCSDLYSLKILFPSMGVAADGLPVYKKYIASDFEYPVPGVELFLLRSPGGFNLDTHLGLLGFLRSCGYMPPAKIARFEKAGRERVVDSSGREVVSEGVFHKNPDTLAMYFYCSTLRLSNHSFVQEEVEAGYILDLLEGPLYNRLAESDRLGHERLLGRILQLMDSFYSSAVTFKARRSGRLSGFNRMSQLMNSFSSQDFRGYSLSEDPVLNAYSFLSLFG